MVKSGRAGTSGRRQKANAQLVANRNIGDEVVRILVFRLWSRFFETVRVASGEGVVYWERRTRSAATRAGRVQWNARRTCADLLRITDRPPLVIGVEA